MAEREEELTVDKLSSGDKPSIYTAGLIVSHALKLSKTVTLGVDVLGRVVVVPPSYVTLNTPLYLSDESLDSFSEERAIDLMLQEKRSDEDMVGYLSRRGNRHE